MVQYQQASKIQPLSYTVPSDTKTEKVSSIFSSQATCQGTGHPPYPLFLHPIQAKMVLGGAQDQYEREADQVAKRVVSRLHQRNQ